MATPYESVPHILRRLGRPVSALTCDSRKTTQGMVFAAYPGETSDGRAYIAQAVANGADAGKFRIWANGTIVSTSTWKPFQIGSQATPWGPQYNVESIRQESDVPGAPGAATHFYDLEIQRLDNNQFRLTPCYLVTAAPTSTRYSTTASGCNHTWSWTN